MASPNARVPNPSRSRTILSRVTKTNRKWSRTLGLHESQGSKQRTGDPTQRSA